jgi:hypothetical protein
MSAQPSTGAARVQEPATPAAPSGRLLLRMPSELHGELARAAEREGTSLNQFITRSLAGTVGWNGAGQMQQEAPSTATRRRDTVTLVLVANAVAVGLAAVAAIAILLVAWQS